MPSLLIEGETMINAPMIPDTPAGFIRTSIYPELIREMMASTPLPLRILLENGESLN